MRDTVTKASLFFVLSAGLLLGASDRAEAQKTRRGDVTTRTRGDSASTSKRVKARRGGVRSNAKRDLRARKKTVRGGGNVATRRVVGKNGTVLKGKLAIGVYAPFRAGDVSLKLNRAVPGTVYQALPEKQGKAVKLGDKLLGRLYDLHYGDKCRYTESNIKSPNWDPHQLSYMVVWVSCLGKESGVGVCSPKTKLKPTGATSSSALPIIKARNLSEAKSHAQKAKLGGTLRPVVLFGSRAHINALEHRLKPGLHGLSGRKGVLRGSMRPVAGSNKKKCLRIYNSKPPFVVSHEQWFGMKMY